MSINKMIKDIEKGCKNDIPSKYLALFGIKEERQCGDLTKSPDDLECGEENELILCLGCRTKRELLITIKEIIEDEIKDKDSDWISGKAFGKKLLGEEE
jgi:hypothetical protein